MRISNVTQEQIERALGAADFDRWWAGDRKDDNGNLTFNRFDAANAKGTAFLVTLRVRDSHSYFARRSYKGRRMVSACWHAYYAFLKALFDLAPDAKVATARITYKGREDFDLNAPGTGRGNIGSRMEPMAYADACDCHGVAWTRAG